MQKKIIKSNAKKKLLKDITFFIKINRYQY